METAAHLVVNAAAAHRVQGHFDRRQGVAVANALGLCEQQEQQRFLRELGRLTEAALEFVVAHQRLINGVEDGAAAEFAGSVPALAEPRHGIGDLLAPPYQVLALPGPELGDSQQKRAETFRGEIGSGKKRLAFRGQKTRHRPPATTGDQVYRLHVGLIDIGAALPVDLDRNEMPIQKRGDGLVFEALAFHDMTPVTGRIANRKKHRLVFASGAGECFRTPGIPVDRVMGMLEQIGRVFENQPVDIFRAAIRAQMFGTRTIIVAPGD